MELHNNRANSFSFTEVLISYKQNYSISRFCSHVLELQIFYRLLDVVFCIKEMLSRANSFRKFRPGEGDAFGFHCLLLKFSFVHKRSFFQLLAVFFVLLLFCQHRIPDVFLREYVDDFVCLTADVLYLSCFSGVSFCNRNILSVAM